MSDTHLANEPAARTETGELVNQATVTAPVVESKPAVTTTSTQGPDTDEKSTTSTDTSAKPVTVEAKDDKSLLNKDTKKPEPAAAPEKYEAFTVPDGFTLDETVSKEAGDLFKGLNLSQTQAQSLVDFYIAKTSEAAEAPFKAYETMRQDWQTQMKADPELGPNLPKVKETIARAFQAIGDAKLESSFREAMDLTGAGDHPAFAKFFYKLAQRVVEGRHVSGSGPSPAGQRGPNDKPASIANAMYPNLS